MFQKSILSQLLATFTVFLNIFVFTLWLGWPSAIIPKIKSGEIPIFMTDDDISWMVALLDFGNLLSPIPSGYLMDRFGRLFTLRLAALSFLVSSILALTATTAYQMYLLRLLAGIGKGISCTVAPMYVGEIADSKIRGMLSGLFTVMSSFGLVTGTTFGPYMTFDHFSWLLALFPLLILALTFVISESPYYLFMRRRNEEAEKAFRWFRGDVTNENTSELNAIKKKVESDMQQKTSYSEVFSGKGNRRAMWILMVTFSVQRLGGSTALIAYGAVTLPKSSFWDPQITLMMVGWAGAIASIFTTSLIDSFGRKPLLLISTLGLCLITGSSAIFYFFYFKSAGVQVDVKDLIFLPHVGAILFGVFFTPGIAQIPHTLQGELLPTNIKSQASAISIIVLSITSFIINKIYLWVSSHFGVYVMYLEFCISNLLCFFFTLYYVFETKGKTFSEIQSVLNNT